MLALARAVIAGLGRSEVQHVHRARCGRTDARRRQVAVLRLAALGQTVITTGLHGKPVAGRVVVTAPPSQFKSLREAPAPIAYQLSTGGSTLSVRTDGDTARITQLFRSICLRYFPESMPALAPAARVLADNYADDAHMASLLALATSIALSLAAFGTSVLSADMVQRRAREIVLRKLHGASDPAIGFLVVRGIGDMLLCSAAIRLPVPAVTFSREVAIPFSRVDRHRCQDTLIFCKQNFLDKFTLRYAVTTCQPCKGQCGASA